MCLLFNKNWLNFGASLVAQTVKNLSAIQEDLGSLPGLERSPEEENGNPLQYSCLENSIDRGTWWAIVHGVVKSKTRLSTNTHIVLLAMGPIGK